MITALEPETFSEETVWAELGGDWVPLGGSFEGSGFSIEWHDFKTDREFDWAASLHPDSIEVCLNLSGEGRLQAGRATAEFRDQSIGFYLPEQGKLTAIRNSRQHHQFITLEISSELLRVELQSGAGELHPMLVPLLNGKPVKQRISEIIPLSSSLLELSNSLRKPPVARQAHAVWYRGKALELMAELFFMPSPGDLFATRQQRLARERVRQVVDLLRSDLVEPPSLEEIGKRIGCSPYYLSRTFSKEMNMTIPQYLRKLRIEKAADLLRDGRHNVTEAAFEVGYNSLSHFSQAFCQQMGCCPAMYPEGKKPAE